MRVREPVCRGRSCEPSPASLIRATGWPTYCAVELLLKSLLARSSMDCWILVIDEGRKRLPKKCVQVGIHAQYMGVSLMVL